MYIVINNKKYNAEYMNSFFKRFKGLMLKKDKINKVYVFPRCSSIHTYFMKQNIDVCMLDNNFKVTYIKENLFPNKVLIKKGYYTLEMPLGLAKKIKLNDIIKINMN